MSRRRLRRSIFRNQSETCFGLVPKAGEPRGGLRQPRRVEHVDIARAFGPMRDQPRAFELGQMPGDRRPADRDNGGKIADTARPLGQRLDQFAALGVAESIESIFREVVRLP